ncbi:hypothetical protein RRG08_005202 [Elysia crispata]|uniref:Uncharacterized protein n=1 Tax=Elysia crispata TaxID=231223 RepID=A0AAE0XSS5_9GAST|nr:hypothetical protein RRG08_005202 [Elysia crispata]
MWDRALGYSRKASGTGQALLFTTSCHRIAINLSKVIFIDEIDSLCRLRNSLENDSTRRIKTELLIQMEAAERYDKANIFLLCATNCPWELDKAFLCRFQKRIYIPLPNKACRIQMMKLSCRENTVNLKESDWQRLAHQRPAKCFMLEKDSSVDDNWTPVDRRNKSLGIKAVISDFPPEKVCPRDVTLEDFKTALKLHTATVSADELDRFASFTNSYGQSG